MSSDILQLQKSMYYGDTKDFNTLLEEELLEHDSEYIKYKDNLSAFEYMLMRYDIKINGTGCNTLSKFYENEQSTLLLPEFISRMIKCGIDEYDIENLTGLNITLPTSNIYLKDFTTISIPIDILNQTNIHNIRLDILSKQLKIIGRKIGNILLHRLYGSLKNKDLKPDMTINSFTINDLINIYDKMLPNYNITHIMLSYEMAHKILNIVNKEYPNSNQYDLNNIIYPFNIKLVPIPKLNNNCIIAFNKEFAMSYTKPLNLMINIESILTNNLSDIQISAPYDYNFIDKDAICVININNPNDISNNMNNIFVDTEINFEDKKNNIINY